MIASLEYAGEYNGEVTYSFTFESSGALTFSQDLFMAWENVKATIDEKDWVVSKKSSDSYIEWSFPFAS